MKLKKTLSNIGFVLIVFLLVLFALFPFIQMLSVSLKHSWDWGNPSLIPKQINLDAYKELLSIGQSEKDLPESVKNLLDENPDLTKEQKKQIIDKYKQTGDVFPFLKYFRNSFILSFFAALLSVLIAVFGAYSFSRVRYPGRGVIQRGVLFVYMFGGILILIPLYKMAVKVGLLSTPIGTFIALLVIYLVQTLPVSLYMLGNYFRTIPYSIEEAALMEGCNRLQAIIKIIIPLSYSAILTVFFYAFMIAWNEYLFASVFLKSFKEFYTLPFGLNELFHSKNAIWDRIMAASLLTATPIIGMFMFIQRSLVGSLTSGGVKS
ncbi:MAG: carbohydrate ABC transporter permease [Spirochaetes bacterium]|nr:carbohydrate ABC transporter permease [Spirochaetota bacterium]